MQNNLESYASLTNNGWQFVGNHMSHEEANEVIEQLLAFFDPYEYMVGEPKLSSSHTIQQANQMVGLYKSEGGRHARLQVTDTPMAPGNSKPDILPVPVPKRTQSHRIGDPLEIPELVC